MSNLHFIALLWMAPTKCFYAYYSLSDVNENSEKTKAHWNVFNNENAETKKKIGNKRVSETKSYKLFFVSLKKKPIKFYGNFSFICCRVERKKWSIPRIEWGILLHTPVRFKCYLFRTDVQISMNLQSRFANKFTRYTK